jgi:hypothetical protein
LKRRLIAFLFCLPFLAARLAGQTPPDSGRTVTAVGLGSIVAGDVAHAKDDAVEDALKNALEQVMGTLIESETLVENFQVIEDQITSKTAGYIQKYVVTAERRPDASLYEVTVRAVVKTADLKNDLDAVATLIKRKNTPRLAVVIQENNVGETGFNYFEADMNTAETAIMDFFLTKGFRVVDRSTVMENLNRQKASAILEGNTAQAAALGRMTDAEVVITGKAVAKASNVEAFGATIRTQQATINCKAIRTDTGDLIATATGQGKFSHIDDLTGGTKAIQKACDKVTQDLMTKILDSWQKDISSGNTIALRVQGVGFDQLEKLKASLKYYVRGLGSVIQRDYSNGFASLEVVMRGNSNDLAQRLSGKDIDGMKLRVSQITANSVTLDIVGRAAPAAVDTLSNMN